MSYTEKYAEKVESLKDLRTRYFASLKRLETGEEEGYKEPSLRNLVAHASECYEIYLLAMQGMKRKLLQFVEISVFIATIFILGWMFAEDTLFYYTKIASGGFFVFIVFLWIILGGVWWHFLSLVREEASFTVDKAMALYTREEVLQVSQLNDIYIISSLLLSDSRIPEALSISQAGITKAQTMLKEGEAVKYEYALLLSSRMKGYILSKKLSRNDRKKEVSLLIVEMTRIAKSPGLFTYQKVELWRSILAGNRFLGNKSGAQEARTYRKTLQKEQRVKILS